MEKPSPEFFDRIVVEAGLEPGSILYVGDRLDNDVRPDLVPGVPLWIGRQLNPAAFTVLDDLGEWVKRRGKRRRPSTA